MDQAKKNEFFTVNEERRISLPSNNNCVWHKPEITRVDMKRTMLLPGSANDGTSTARS